MEHITAHMNARCITMSSLYYRVYSYPCLEVYLDKYEVSVNRIAMFYKLVQFSPFKPQCISRCVDRIVVVVPAADAR